jgi:hypothetical protein
VAGLESDDALGHVRSRRGRRQPGPQRVAGELRRIEPGRGRGALDDQRDRLIREPAGPSRPWPSTERKSGQRSLRQHLTAAVEQAIWSAQLSLFSCARPVSCPVSCPYASTGMRPAVTAKNHPPPRSYLEPAVPTSTGFAR